MSAILLICVLLGADDPPQNIPGKRNWLLAHLIVDMQKQGVYDADKFAKIEKMIKNQSPDQIRQLVRYYQLQKQNAKQQYQANLRQAQLNLEKAKAYRDHLQREFDMKIAQRNQEAELMRMGTQMAQSFFWSQVNQRPNYGYYSPSLYARPYYATRYTRSVPRHHHHKR